MPIPETQIEPSSPPPPSCPTKIPTPVPETQTQPNRPPRRKRKESDEKKPVIEKKQDQHSKQPEEPVVYANVDNEVIVDSKENSKIDEILIETVANKTETVHVKSDEDNEVLPKSNTDSYMVDSELNKVNDKTEESLLDTILKDIPSLRKDKTQEEDGDNAVIVSNVKSELEILQPVQTNKNVEDIIVPDKKKDVECEITPVKKEDIEYEITPVKIQSNRGKFHPAESVKIEFKEVEQEVTLNESDSDNEVVTVSQQVFDKDSLDDDFDTLDGYLDLVKPAAFKRSDDLDSTFQKLISFPDTGKLKDTKDTISIKSDISDASSEAPPLPESAPPPLPLSDQIGLTKVPSETEVSEIIVETESTPVSSQREVSEIEVETESTEIIMATAVEDPLISATHELPSPDEPLSPRGLRSPEDPGSPISDLPASIFSMRVKSPVRDEDVKSPTRDIGGEIAHIGGKLEVDVAEPRRHIMSDSDLSDTEEPAEGIFSPGKYTCTKHSSW